MIGDERQVDIGRYTQMDREKMEKVVKEMINEIYRKVNIHLSWLLPLEKQRWTRNKTLGEGLHKEQQDETRTVSEVNMIT